MVWQQPRHAYLLVLGGIPPIVFQGWYNYMYFGNPLHSEVGGGTGFWSGSMLEGLSGLLFSPSRGLFIYSPIFLFSMLVLILSWQRAGSGLLRCLSVGVAGTLLLYSKWFMWWGGWSYGPRLIADLAPVLVFALYPTRSWIVERRLVRGLFLCATFWSIYAHGLGAFIDDNRWNARVEAQIYRNPQRAWDWQDNPLTDNSLRLARTFGRAIGERP
jgi:hypothetical protein